MCGCCGDPPQEEKPRQPKPLVRKNVCCTDIVFLILFVAFWGFMSYIAVYVIIRGDARRLIYGYDSYGNTCNENNVKQAIPNLTKSGQDMTGKENVLFMSLLDPFNSLQICVSKCPDRDLRTAADVKKFAQDTNSTLCDYDVSIEDYGDSSLYHKYGPCPELPIFTSVSLLQRCTPDPLALIGIKTPDLQRQNATILFFNIFEFDNLFRKVMSDLYNSWQQMLVLCCASVVIAFLMVLLMRFLAVVVVWLIVVLSILGSCAGTGFLWWTYVRIKNDLDLQELWKVPLLDVQLKNEKAFLIFSIIATVLTVILLLIILVLRKRIALTVALFKEAGKCLVDLPLLLIQPFWTFIVLAVFIIFWLIIMAFIATAGDPKLSYPDDGKRGFTRVTFELDGLSKHFWWIYIINLIWTSEFILASQQFVIAGAVATWYFTRNKKQLGCPIGQSVCRLILHHIGSIALGAFIITMVKLPRYILMYLHSKMEGSENSCAKCCLKCCICCLWCLEKVLKFLNQNAYTIIAMKGESFCPAAKQAFTTIALNVLRVAAINSVGGFVLFLGKIGVMAAACGISVLWLRENGTLHFYAIPVFLVCVFAFLCAHCALSVYEDQFHYYAVPVIFIAFFSFMTANCFLSLYEMVVDVLLLCFCEDCSLNDGSEGREYYMSNSLMKFVESTNSTMAARTDRSNIQPTTEEHRLMASPSKPQ